MTCAAVLAVNQATVLEVNCVVHLLHVVYPAVEHLPLVQVCVKVRFHLNPALKEPRFWDRVVL